MKRLPPADAHHVRAAEGWLELGNWREANEELENVTAALRAHPDVLKMRWHVYAAAKDWPLAVEVARALTKMLPGNAEAWLGLACSECRMGRLLEAKACLEKTFELDLQLRTTALEAPDPEPLWKEIGTL